MLLVLRRGVQLQMAEKKYVLHQDCVILQPPIVATLARHPLPGPAHLLRQSQTPVRWGKHQKMGLFAGSVLLGKREGRCTHPPGLVESRYYGCKSSQAGHRLNPNDLAAVGKAVQGEAAGGLSPSPTVPYLQHFLLKTFNNVARIVRSVGRV